MNTKSETNRSLGKTTAHRGQQLVAVALLSLLAGVTGLLISNPLSADTETTIEVQARGDAGGELLAVIADDELIDTLTLSQTLTPFEVTSPSFPSNVRVEFINDSKENGVDRNAVVEYIEVGGTRYSPTDPGVLSTGGYTQGSGCTDGAARSVRLFCNGYFEFRIDAPPLDPADQANRIEVRAHGQTGEERIELRVGDTALAKWTLSTEAHSFIHDTGTPLSGADVEVHFINDDRSEQGDRNAHIDFIAVNGNKLEAEDPDVYSEGSHTSETGCSPGNKGSETLHCGGFFRFSIPELEAPTVSTEVPAAEPAAPAQPAVVEEAPESATDDDEGAEDDADAEATEQAVLSASVARAGARNANDAPTTATAAAPAPAASVDVSIFARGNTGEERIELRIDGNTVARFNVTKALREYQWSSTESFGERALAVHFVNDGRSDGGDRNVTIDRVVVGGERFQTESGTTRSRGAWADGSCQDLGFHRSETLACNGFLNYNIGNAGQLQSNTATAAPATAVEVAAFPKAGHNGEAGCVENCRTVGFQNLDGKRNFTLENVIISNPGGPCMSIENASNITIRNVTVQDCATTVRSNRGGVIDITNSSDITITGSLFVDNSNRNVTNYDLLRIENASDVTIRNSEIRDLHSNTGSGDTGNRAILVTGNRSDNLVIEHNSFYNPGRNALQITRAQSLSGVKIVNNRIEGSDRWASEFEDMINFFSSSGTSASPIIVADNYMRNGGPSDSGTAIIVGDGKGNTPSAYITVERNVIVDPGHVGINVAGGHHFIVRDNIIFGGSDVGLWTATGLTINHYRYTPECRDHQIYGNRVFFKNQHRQQGGTNHLWNPGTCNDNVKFYDNTIGDRSLTYDVWDLDD